ncbi:MAG: hypothetical protein A2049_09690 [Elusimicrobia bacterium GWA2_62_23]|nr:MAG: hypothetical protein A2049_09690 [Elusimicrobia bacterium GWA2_62_23]
MMTNLFPFRLLFRPGAAFEDLAAGRVGWAWPAALWALGTLSSAALLAWAPRDFLAATAAGLPPPDGGFASYALQGLAGGLLFSVFSCALLAGFSRLLAGGRLMLRVPLPAGAAALYALAFLALRAAPAFKPAGWLLLLAVIFLAALGAYLQRAVYPALLKVFLALSVFALASDLLGLLALAAGSPDAYKVVEYAVSAASLLWLVRAVAAVTGLSAARSAAAAVPALLGAAAFAFSLLTLGLLSPEVFQLLLMM